MALIPPTFKPYESYDSLYTLHYYSASFPKVAFLPENLREPDDVITLDDSWNSSPGRYFFFNEVVTDETHFLNNLGNYLNLHDFAKYRFFWIANPNKDYTDWEIETLIVDGNIGDNFTNTHNTFTVGNYLLQVGGGCPITFHLDGEEYYYFLIGSPTDGREVCFLESEAGTYHFPIQQGSVRISFKQGFAGQLLYNLEVGATPDETTLQTKHSFDTLDLGIRYYINHPEFEGQLYSLRYPIFQTPENLWLVAALDPLNHLDPERTYFSIMESSTMLDSYYRTSLGQTVQMQPTDSVKFVFAQKSMSAPPLLSHGDDLFTLVPMGTFDLYFPAHARNIKTGEPYYRMLGGVSGLEYLGFMNQGGNQVHFFPNQPAYAANFQFTLDFDPSYDLIIHPATTRNNALDDFATTSYAYFGSLIVYYAQPEAAVLYDVEERGSLVDYLDFLEVPVAQLIQVTTQAQLDQGATLTAFPMTPYAGLESQDIELYQLFEKQILSPTRREIIKNLKESPNTDDNEVGSVKAVTSQGLLIELNDNKSFWKEVTLGRSINRDGNIEPGQYLRFANVEGGFKEALQSNQLCLVANDPEAILANSTMNYQLTDFASAELLKEGFPQAELDKMNSGNPSMLDFHYDNKSEFRAALIERDVDEEYVTDDQSIIYRYCADAFLFIEGGWTFNLAPYFWNNGERDTIMIFKYAGQSLEELIEDPNTWAWKEAIKGTDSDDLEATNQAVYNLQKNILSIFADAKEQAAHSIDFNNFLNKIANPDWQGVLFLNVAVPLDALPEQLAGLAIGIDEAGFYGHHLGIDSTPIAHGEDGELDIQPSSLFGLIYYNDTEDQYYDGIHNFAYKVLSLRVLFLKSKLKNYGSQIELLITNFFGEEATMVEPTRGNNLILNGVYQNHDGKASYVFLEDDVNIFSMTSSVLSRVIINHAELVMVNPPDEATALNRIHAKFLLRGILEFKAIPYFDVFSFGPEVADLDTSSPTGLKFAGLVINMSYNEDEPATKTFNMDASNLAFDMDGSIARSQSFFNHFPLEMNRLIQSIDDKKEVIVDAATSQAIDAQTKDYASPGDLGYMSVTSPLVQSKLEQDWFGFSFQLDLGSLGSLTNGMGYLVEIFAGWAPTNSTEEYKMYIGVKLPGTKSDKTEIPIEGMLKLSFKKIELLANEVVANPVLNQPAGMAYLLKFRTIALKLLGLSYPPGQIDMYLFGNPDNNKSALGWYACYVGEK